MNCNISYNIYNKCIFARPNVLQIILVALLSINYLSIFAYNKTERIKIEKTPEIQKGKNCIWHITTPSDISNVDYIKYQDKNDTIIILADKQLSKYIRTKDGLSLITSENPTTFLEYSPKGLQTIPFNLQLNDSVVSPYNAEGVYCGKYNMSICGNLVIKVIGMGKMMVNQEEVIENVVLLVREKKENVSINYPQKREQAPITRIVKSYIWYDATNYHVILNYENQRFFANNLLVSQNSVCYKYNSNTFQEAQEDEKSTNNQKVLPLFEYSLNVTAKQLKISYSSAKSHDFRIQICDIAGIVYCNKNYSKQNILPSGELSFNLSHLCKGIYVAYIFVDGQVYCKSFSL